MSVSVTTVNGLVVVTQVFQPGEELKIPMNTIDAPAASAAPAVPATVAAKPVESDEPSIPVSPMTKQFLRGQPKPLGIVQILLGLVTVALGIMIMWQRPLMWAAPIWTGALYVLSGTISVIAHRGTRPGLIRSCLALNVLSSLAAVAGIVIVAIHLATVRQDDSGCLSRSGRYYYDDGDYQWMCQEMFWKYRIAMDGIRGLLIALAALELAVALSGAIIAGKASCLSSVPPPKVVVIQKPAVRADSFCGSDERLLGSDEGLLGSDDPPSYDA